MINLLIMSFVGGLITFVSPCVLPLIPAYVFYITGLKLDDKSGNKRGYILNIVLFIIGFTIVFVTLGILTGLLFFLVKGIRFYLDIIFGIIIVIFGLHFMGLLRIFFLNAERRFDMTAVKIDFAGSLLMGMAFAAGWTPCIGPVLGTILGLVASQGSLVRGIILLTVFSLGLGIPLFITALFFNNLKPVLDYLKKHSTVIRIVSGLFLILIGILIIFGSLNQINIFLARFSTFMENHPRLFNMILTGIFIVPGLIILAVSFIRSGRIRLIPLIFSILFIITGFLIFIDLIPVLKILINYFRYGGF